MTTIAENDGPSRAQFDRVTEVADSIAETAREARFGAPS